MSSPIDVTLMTKLDTQNSSVPRSTSIPAWRVALRGCDCFEWATLAYLGVLNTLILIFHRNLNGWPLFFFGHLALGAGIVALCWAADRWSRGFGSAPLRFLRHWYPLPLFLFFFEELHHLVHLIFPGWFDGWLIAFDYALLGVHPTVWLEQFARPWLNDLMQAAYMSYYFYVVVLVGLLYMQDKMREFRMVMVASGVAYYIGYVIAILFPIESPYHTLALLQRVELTGGFFTALQNQIEFYGRVHGAAFPSAHVAGSMVPLMAAWRYRRWLFWAFLPMFLLMLVATIYGRYHYLADVLAGLVTGYLGFRLAAVLMPHPQPPSESPADVKLRARRRA